MPSQREQWYADRQRLAALDIPAALSPRSAQLFLLLLDRAPAWVDETAIRSRIFDGMASAETVRVLLWRTRKQLAGTPYTIERRGHGFGQVRLVSTEPPAVLRPAADVVEHQRINRETAERLEQQLLERRRLCVA